MEALQAVVLGIVLVAALAAASVVLLGRSFRRLLVELCGSESHGRFWLAFACLAIVLTSTFAALVAVPASDPALQAGDPGFRYVLTTFRTGLLGLLLSLAAVALALLVSIAQRASNAEPPRPGT
jgi:hypothetical protein